MITREGALDDLKKLEEGQDKDNVAKVVIEVTRILVKLLSTIRSNQLLTEEEKIIIRKAKETRKPVQK